eukprot:UN22080
MFGGSMHWIRYIDQGEFLQVKFGPLPRVDCNQNFCDCCKGHVRYDYVASVDPGQATCLDRNVRH